MKIKFVFMFIVLALVLAACAAPATSTPAPTAMPEPTEAPIEEPAAQNIVEIAAEDGRFTTLVAANNSGLQGSLVNIQGGDANIQPE